MKVIDLEASEEEIEDIQVEIRILQVLISHFPSVFLSLMGTHPLCEFRNARVRGASTTMDRFCRSVFCG